MANENNNLESVAQRSVREAALSETEMGRLNKIFLNVYDIMKKGKPFSEIQFLFELDRTKGLDIGKT